MTLIVAVKSCQRDRDAGFHDAIRETWGRELKQMGVQVMFFLGHTGGGYFQAHPKGVMNSMLRDEVIVDTPDDYNSLPYKTRSICFWAQSKIFSHLFLCDNDTVISAKGFKSLLYEPFDYAGHFRGGQDEIGTKFYYRDHIMEYPECRPWASGGFGYFISKAATEVLVDSYPKIWAEDMWVGQVLGKEIEKGRMLGAALSLNKIATWHYPKNEKYPKFTPDILRGLYENGEPQWN